MQDYFTAFALVNGMRRGFWNCGARPDAPGPQEREFMGIVVSARLQAG
ncbi:MAG: hypothetical protein WD278_14520 [Pirellulales bacterium]